MQAGLIERAARIRWPRYPGRSPPVRLSCSSAWPSYSRSPRPRSSQHLVQGRQGVADIFAAVVEVHGEARRADAWGDDHAALGERGGDGLAVVAGEAGGDDAGPAGGVAWRKQSGAALGQPVGELAGELAVVSGDLSQAQAGDVAD